MSSSSIRQHQRRTAANSGGHSPLARNHSVGAPLHHHSSLPSTASQRSNTSLPSPNIKTTTTTTTETIKPTSPPTTMMITTSENYQSPSSDKSPTNFFNFDHQLGHFRHSSINSKTSTMNVPRSTRLLCGSIVPLQASTSSPNIDHRSLESDPPISPIFSPLSIEKTRIEI